jgi:hypothetical protein
MPHVETAKDGSTLPDLYGEVKAILGARGEILAGIKNESQYGGVVDQRIINHQFKGTSNNSNPSLPRRRESNYVKSLWIPAFAGMTFLEVALNLALKGRIGKREFHPPSQNVLSGRMGMIVKSVSAEVSA